jgi:pSer/pThr/pTyr-binding forkhead associated (FHA) protein
MDEAFDPYYVWLGIPPSEQPPHHYRLLGVALFEPRSDVIQVAAQKQITHVKSFVIGEFADAARRLLTELTQAKLCLLNPSKRAQYDARLRSQLAQIAAPTPAGVPAASAPGPSPRPGTPEQPEGRQPTPVPSSHLGVKGRPAPQSGPKSADATEPCPTTRAWIVGADPNCDVVVPAPPVSARHCRLIQTGDALYIEDLCSTNGTYVDGRRINGRVRISTASRVTLGRRVPLPFPAELLPAALQDVPRILYIGATPDNDIVIDLPTISGRHARLVAEHDAVYIEDLDSTNGTSVGSPANRVRRAKLEPSDVVYLGSYPILAAHLLERLGATGK